MSNNRNTKKSESKSPTLYAYTVREPKQEGQKAFWTRIGAYFPHDDNEGGTLVLEALPLDGRVVLRAPKNDE